MRRVRKGGVYHQCDARTESRLRGRLISVWCVICIPVIVEYFRERVMNRLFSLQIPFIQIRAFIFHKRNKFWTTFSCMDWIFYANACIRPPTYRFKGDLTPSKLGRTEVQYVKTVFLPLTEGSVVPSLLINRLQSP